MPSDDRARSRQHGGSDRRTVDAFGARLSGLLLLAILAVLAWSLGRTWLTVRMGTSLHHFSALNIPGLDIAMPALVALAAVGVLIESVALGRWPVTTPVMAATGLIALTTVLLLGEEAAGSILPTGLLPASVRRGALNIHGGLGIWVALIAGLAVIGVGRTPTGLVGLVRAVAAVAIRDLLPAAACGGILAVVCWARYQPWIHVATAGQAVRIPGWSIPWVGPATLLVAIALGASLLAGVVLRGPVVALATVALAWGLTFAAALSILFASTLGRLAGRHWLPTALRSYSPHVAVGWGAWLMFFAGLAAAAVGWENASIRLDSGRTGEGDR